MKKIKFLVFSVGVLALSSCGEIAKEAVATSMELDDEMKTYTNDSVGYSLSVPSYMNKVTTLHADATMQFQNVFKETYLIVIDEPKDDVVSTFRELGEYKEDSSLVKNYRDIQLKYIAESSKIVTQSKPVAYKINGLDAETVKIDANVEGIPQMISYTYTFIASNETVYMVSAWTLKDKKEKNAPLFDKIVKSFKEVPKKKVQ